MKWNNSFFNVWMDQLLVAWNLIPSFPLFPLFVNLPLAILTLKGGNFRTNLFQLLFWLPHTSSIRFIKFLVKIKFLILIIVRLPTNNQLISKFLLSLNFFFGSISLEKTRLTKLILFCSDRTFFAFFSFPFCSFPFPELFAPNVWTNNYH